MTTNELDELFATTYAEVQKLTHDKGHDYASDEDRLSNFKDQAKKLGLTPYKIWAVYANKHWDAINAFVRNNGQLESEPIESRVHDIIVYSFLLLALVSDKAAEDAGIDLSDIPF